MTATAAPEYRPIHVLFEARAAAVPHRVALVHGDSFLSYGELNARANRLAHQLLALGLSPGTVIGICAPRSLAQIVGILAILKAGGAYFPLDPAYPAERLAFMLGDARPPVVLATAATAERLPLAGAHAPGAFVLLLDGDASEIERRDASDPPCTVTADSLCYLIYTSGSTGMPKGTLVPHRSVPGVMVGVDYVRLDEDQVFLLYSSSSWDAFTLELWSPLLHGGRCVLMPHEKFAPAEMADSLRRYGVNTLFLPTAAFNLLVAEMPEALEPVSQLMTGGEVMPPASLLRCRQLFPDKHLCHVYGPSECTVFATAWPVPRDLDLQHSVPIGKPVGDRRIYLLDANLRRVGVGVPGEICIGGPAVALGYLDRPELTAAKFVADPYAAEPRALLYRTGDRGRYLPDGAIEFLGRSDNQVKVRGYRVELEELELALGAHPAVAQCAVMMREDTPGDKRLVAYVAPRPDQHRGGGQGRDEAAASQVSGWAAIFDEHVYGAAGAAADPLFNTAGWVSTYDGLPIPEPQMRVWAQDIVAKALAGAPRDVLEIGCGTGMLLFQILPGCRGYHAVDISQACLDYVGDRLAELRPAPAARVRLERRAAHELDDLAPASLDVVILSSVVQYFPDVHYLHRVLAACAEAVRPGGRIVVADLRRFDLQRTFYAALELHRAAADSPRAALLANVQKEVDLETELLVDPAYFAALPGRLGRIGAVELHLQRGAEVNELNKYRYHAVLHVAPAAPAVRAADAPAVEVPAAPADGGPPVTGAALTFEDLRRMLGGGAAAPACWRLDGLADSRLLADLAAAELTASGDGGCDTAGALRAALPRAVARRPAGIDPEALVHLAAEAGYSCILSPGAAPGSFDAVLARSSPPVPDLAPPAPPATSPVPEIGPPRLAERPRREIGSYANQPLRSHLTPTLIPALRQHLAERLPDFMMPSAFVILESLPWNAAGKVDRASLPRPGTSRTDLAVAYVAPRNATEKVVAELFAKLLNRERVGIRDVFFELGGHSLLATQLVSRLRKTFRTDLPLRTVFEHPTVAGIAEFLAAGEERPGRIERIAELQLAVASMPEEQVLALLASRQAAARGGEERT
jgi:amino acid adenylation domain-containing protein